MKVVIFGSAGFMGRHFLSLFPDALCPSIDIADMGAVDALFASEKPDFVINAAGKTGRPNVDWCEDHKLETLHANVTGPLVLAELCQKHDIYWMHLSSGCIYEGDNGGAGFTEEDQPNFSGSFYSRTKTWSDQMLKDITGDSPDAARVLVLRLRMPFDSSEDPRNLIMKLKKYQKVLDAENSLTCIDDFLIAAKALIEKKKTGVYNIVNPGLISPFAIMTKYKEIVDPNHQFEKLSLTHLSDVVKAGRSNCVLSTEKLEKEGIHLRSVSESIASALAQIAS